MDKIYTLEEVKKSKFYIKEILTIGLKLYEQKYEILKKYLPENESLLELDRINKIKDTIKDVEQADLLDSRYELQTVCKFLKNDLKSVVNKVDKDRINKIIEDIGRYDEETRFIKSSEDSKEKTVIPEIIDLMKQGVFEISTKASPVSDEDAKSIILIGEQFERFSKGVSIYIEEVESWQLKLEKKVVDSLNGIKDILSFALDQLEVLDKLSSDLVSDVLELRLFDYVNFKLNSKLIQIDQMDMENDLDGFKDINENVGFKNMLIDLYNDKTKLRRDRR